MWHATGTVLAQAPNPLEIRRGDYSHDGWDGALQRINSTPSTSQLSNVSSTPAQTPGSLVRTLTSTLGAHPEEEHEGELVDESKGHGLTVGQKKDLEAEEDPFSKFVGRGRIQSQSYEPGVKADADVQGEDVGDDDFPQDLHPRKPVKRRSTLPKKFMDRAGEHVPKPEGPLDDKLNRIRTMEAPIDSSNVSKEEPRGPNELGVYPNGYKFPPKHTWGEAMLIGLKGFWKFFLTPLGFLITIYGLNVVAWGGMLFLLLIGGGKEFMCYPPGSHGEKDCNNLQAPRRIWIEIDSQILNGLFCVTGFGLIPWRFRDLYFLLKYRLRKSQSALRKLAGIHRSWFRLAGSNNLSPTGAATSYPDADTNPAIPIPASKAPDAPLTGFRAPPTTLWKLDFVIWMYVLNTALQAVLSGFMWGLNRYNRPSWSTGTFVALACIVAGLGGLMCFFEGKRIKAIEGIPVEEEKVLQDVEKAVERAEKGEGKSVTRKEKELTHRLMQRRQLHKRSGNHGHGDHHGEKENQDHVTQDLGK